MHKTTSQAKPDLSASSNAPSQNDSVSLKTDLTLTQQTSALKHETTSQAKQILALNENRSQHKTTHNAQNDDV
ncbi:hypothetical protein F511_16345 [Dorcoceras hygrometricum]|uniref:Uncharacterized protein n=1 Tax=Dorcoceras hygrometricum TaxID=472368 RepID=A0A2Z7BRK5_9LAMI|nr:hypothetical protein F511_16345 [Dorcoceras hygrometricum]